MGFSRGPTIVTDGLVLALDAANQKSFRGEPTVNLWDFDISNRCWSSNSSNACALRTTTGKHSFILNGVCNVPGASAFVYPVFSTSNTIHTLSCSVKNNDNRPVTVMLFIRDGNNGTTLRQVNFTIEANSIDRIHITSNSAITSSQITPAIYPRTNPTDGFINIEVFDIQLESKPYSTPFVNGTRGTTVATGGGWVDRSGNNNHGQLINNVTFNSSNLGSLVFDGTNQRINLTSFSVPFLTLSTWVFRTSTANNQGICRKENGWAVSHFNGVLQVAPGTSWTFYNTGYVIPLNTWVNITYRYIGSGSNSQSVFINGVLIWTNSNGTGSLPTNSNQVRIGFDDNNWWWGGRISQTQIYNRALTDVEILQNFSATKSRYEL